MADRRAHQSYASAICHQPLAIAIAEGASLAHLECCDFAMHEVPVVDRAVVDAFKPPYEAGEILRHVFQFGWRSAPLILTSGFAVGVVLSMHTRATLERFGAEAMIPAGLALP